jgi:hypothetical protein
MSAELQKQTTTFEFRDDKTYLQWVAENPHAYVLTSNKSLTPRHTVVHRSACKKITALTGNASSGGFTRNYIKIGSDSVSALREWATTFRSDAVVRECTFCAGT